MPTVRCRKVLERIGFTSEIGRESIFHAVHEAAEAFQADKSVEAFLSVLSSKCAFIFPFTARASGRMVRLRTKR